MKKLIYFLTIMLIFSSCEETETYEPKENLNNAYIESVIIINFPPYYWDTGSSPDLQLKLSIENSSDWTYISELREEVEEVPITLRLSDRAKISNEDWELELIDKDNLNADDIIYRIIFNPFKNADNGKIPIYNNGLLVLEFNYIIS